MTGLGLRQIRRVVVFVLGMTLLLIGVIMLVTPGPAFIVIPASLALLGLEFRWARRLLRKARTLIHQPATKAAGGGKSAKATASVRTPPAPLAPNPTLRASNRKPRGDSLPASP